MLKRFFSLVTLVAGAIGALLLGMAAWWAIEHDVWSISLDGDWSIPLQAIAGAILVVGGFVAYTRRPDSLEKVKRACVAAARAGISVVWVCMTAFFTFSWIIFLVRSSNSDISFGSDPLIAIFGMTFPAILLFQWLVCYPDSHNKKKETFYSDDLLDEH